MKARYRRLLSLATALALAGAGCRHYTGYIERHARRTPLPGATRVVTQEPENPIRILGEPDPGNGVIELQVVRKEAHERLIRREILARRTYVAYEWYTPVVKTGLMLSIVCPFWFPLSDPHNHSGGSWTKWDYLYDVTAYYNLFSAYPAGPQQAEQEWTVLADDKARAPVKSREAPWPNARVRLTLGGRTLAEASSDASGAVTLDLAPHLTPQVASADREFTITLLQGAREGSALPLLVKSETMKALLASRPDRGPAAPPEGPRGPHPSIKNRK